jgi:hypothetical protein
MNGADLVAGDYKVSVEGEARSHDICINAQPVSARINDPPLESCFSQLSRRGILLRNDTGLLKGEEHNMLATDAPLLAQLDRFIAGYKLRIQQQRIHARELSAAPMQQKHAQAQLVAMRAGLAKLQQFRKRLT